MIEYSRDKIGHGEDEDEDVSGEMTCNLETYHVNMDALRPARQFSRGTHATISFTSDPYTHLSEIV